MVQALSALDRKRQFLMSVLLTRSLAGVLCVNAAGLFGISASPSQVSLSVLLVIGLVGATAIVTTALAFSAGARLWSLPIRGRMSAAGALAASDAIDLARLDSDKG
jgi:hypothetical protein